MVTRPALPRALRAVVLTLLAATTPSWTAPVPAEDPPVAPSVRVLRFGVIAEEPNEPDRMLRVYGPLLVQLRQRIASNGIGVPPLVVARDLDDLAGRVMRGEVDLVVETVFPTLALQERGAKLVPELVVPRRGQREYHSVFFTRQDAPIHSLADLRGRTLVLQALRSTSAFAIPRAELARVGLRVVPADAVVATRAAVRYVLAGAEINQAVWVLHGRGDAGAFNEGDWANLPKRMRAQLRVFHETRPIIRGLLSFRFDLDPRVHARAREALLGLSGDEAGMAALVAAAGITRLEPLRAVDRSEIEGWRATLRAVDSR